MTIITTDDVFNFMGTQTDVRTQQETNILALITRIQKQIEEFIGRKVESIDFANMIMQNGLYCQILGQKLFLEGIFRDTYKITAIEENGTSLEAVTEYNDNKDYYFDSNKGLIFRNNQNWSTEPFAIKISGSCGLGDWDGVTFTENNDIKQILIETVATKSGLWKTVFQSEGGEVTTTKTTLNNDTKKALEKYKLITF